MNMSIPFTCISIQINHPITFCLIVIGASIWGYFLFKKYP